MITKLTTKLRAFIADEGDDKSEQGFEYTTSYTFTLALEASAITQVLINGTATTNYTFSSTYNTVTITENMTVGDIITVKYTYSNFSDAELKRYLKLAVSDLSCHSSSGKNFEVEANDNIYPIPSLPEQNLICKIAYLRIKPDYQKYSMPNMSVTNNKTKDIDGKIKELINDFYSGANIGDTLVI